MGMPVSHATTWKVKAYPIVSADKYLSHKGRTKLEVAQHTDIEVRDELGQRLPREVHRTQALPKEREPWPGAILDEPPRF
jgi:hypothetical protein